MKCKLTFIVLLVLVVVTTTKMLAQTSGVLSQDLVMKDGKLFSGKADFKFAIVSDQRTLWSNDGSSIDGSEPKTSVLLDVTKGVYSVELGSAEMKPLFYELLKFFPNPHLVTWVASENGFVEFSKQAIDPKIVDWLDTENEKAILLKKSQPAPGVVEWANNDVKEKKPDNEQKEATNAEGYMNFRRMQRADANGKIPMDGLVNAQRHISGMPKPKDAGLWNWEWLGPSNIGGRIRAIAINPLSTNTIFIGGAGGGLWKSTNGGSSWSVVDDFLPSLAITSIVYDPTNNSIMYASTGEGFYNFDALPGAGIFKSTNGGTTWTQLASTNNTDFTWVNRIAHHPDSTGVLYAATKEPHRVWKTIDGGTTWTSLLSATYAVCDIRVSTHGTHNNLVAGCWGYGSASWTNSGEVYTSNNWGKTWTQQTTGAANKMPSWPQRCEVSFCPNNSNWIYVVCGKSNGEVWRSDDLGSTWTLRGTPAHMGTQQWYDNCIWVDPTNSNRLVVGGIDNWRSTDGGATFTRISDWHDYHNNGSANSAHADNHIIINHPGYDGSTNKIVFFGNDGGIQKATDILTVSQNSGWTNLAGTTLGITQFHGGAAAPDGSFIIGGTQDNDHIRYKPSGAWSGSGGWYQAETGDGGRAAVDFSNTANQYSEYTNLVIEKSTNSGDSWFNSYTGITDAGTDNALFISPFVMDPNASNRLIGGSLSIWRTTNSAANWSSIRASAGAKCSAIDIADGNSDIIWVGYEDGHVAKTTTGTNAAPTWTRVDNNATALPNRYVTDIAINPSNHSEVYVTFGGYNVDNVWFTDDAGASWQNRSGTAPNELPALQVNTVKVHPLSSNWIYIGTDLGVFASEDKGVNWSVDPRYSAQNNEMPANAEVAELFWQGDYYLIAATHGRGMYRAQPMIIIYVDKLAAPGGNGSAAAPFQTVTEAVNVSGRSTIISIKSNTYDEAGQIIFTKKGMIYSTNGASIIK
jgi:hypothetical protein